MTARCPQRVQHGTALRLAPAGSPTFNPLVVHSTPPAPLPLVPSTRVRGIHERPVVRRGWPGQLLNQTSGGIGFRRDLRDGIAPAVLIRQGVRRVEGIPLGGMRGTQNSSSSLFWGQTQTAPSGRSLQALCCCAPAESQPEGRRYKSMRFETARAPVQFPLLGTSKAGNIKCLQVPSPKRESCAKKISLRCMTPSLFEKSGRRVHTLYSSQRRRRPGCTSAG